MNTHFPSAKAVARAWHLIDAENQVLGRVASRAATILMGKHKPTYTPFLDTGDHVVIINAEKIRLTGAKEDQKLYRRHSGYPGGLVEQTARQVRQAHPERIVEMAVKGTLPKSKLGKQMSRKLKLYAGSQHPHEAQQPVALSN